MRTPFTYEAWVEVLKKENAELKNVLQAVADENFPYIGESWERTIIKVNTVLTKYKRETP